jgi:hypothetical protein
MQHASRWVLVVLVGGGAVKGLQVRATPHPPSPPRSKCLADRRRAGSALCRTQLMKCLTRPQICPAAALQVLEQLASPGPCIAHHLVRPWCSGVPREAQFTCKCSRGTGSPPSGFCTFFFLPIGGAARNQLPHDVERNGSRTLSRGARVAVVPLRGPERWGFELLM